MYGFPSIPPKLQDYSNPKQNDAIHRTVRPNTAPHQQCHPNTKNPQTFHIFVSL